MHFILVKCSNLVVKYAKFSVDKYVSLHGILCPSFLKLNDSFHPQTDGKVERTIQTQQYMLGDCVVDFKGSWDNQLRLVDFSYNNNYHSSISMEIF